MKIRQLLNEGDAWTDGKKYFSMVFTKFTAPTGIGVMVSAVQDLYDDGKISKTYVKQISKSLTSAQNSLAKLIK